MLKMANLPPHIKAQGGFWNFLTNVPVRYQLCQQHITDDIFLSFAQKHSREDLLLFLLFFIILLFIIIIIYYHHYNQNMPPTELVFLGVPERGFLTVTFLEVM